MSRHTRANPIQEQLKDFSELPQKTFTPKIKIIVPKDSVQIVHSKNSSDIEDSDNSFISQNTTVIPNKTTFSVVKESTEEIGADIFDKSTMENSNEIETKTTMEKYFQVSKLVEQIPIFSGKRGPNTMEELLLFMQYCNQTYNHLEKMCKPIFLDIITGRLRGDAYLLAHSVHFETLQEFEHFLVQHFSHKLSPTDILNKITQSRQKHNETVKNFAERIETLVTEMQKVLKTEYPGQDLSVYLSEINKQACNAFKIGIRNPIIQLGLVNNNLSDLQSLINSAIKFEQFENQKNQSYHEISNNNDLYSMFNANNENKLLPSTSIESKLNQQQETLDFLMKNLNKDLKSEKRHFFTEEKRNIICDFCQRKGHLIEDCRIRRNTPYCRRCQSYGHNCERKFFHNQINRSNQEAARPSYINQNEKGYMNKNYNGFNKGDSTNKNIRYTEILTPSVSTDNNKSTNESGNEAGPICNPQIAAHTQQ